MNHKKFYITTPIYYVNDRPHIGHAYTTIVADVLARSRRLAGHDVLFLTGTDENSQKTVAAAQKNSESVRSYADRLATVWENTWKELGITNTDFIRTTESRHIEAVQSIWRLVYDNGDIYKGHYQGLYCKGHEAFMKEDELVDGLCPDHKTKPELISEENYFFRLSKYQKQLSDFYEAHKDFVVPSQRFNEVKQFVARELQDISISREKREWGIPVPGDPSQVIYVWFDALVNYISAIDIDGWRRHPADIHVVGKDITRFHAVIWPAMLLSAGLSLPRQIIANGFFTINGEKISKSLDNTVDPLLLVEKYTVDGLRYFLLREVPFGEDGDYSEAKFKERYNADLANGLGNFAARVLTLGEGLKKIGHDMVPEKEVAARIDAARRTIYGKTEEFKFNEALVATWDLISFGDEYVNKTAPWGIEDAAKKSQAVFNLVVILDNVAALLQPFLPETADKIAKSISWEEGTLKIKKGEVLFPRLG